MGSPDFPIVCVPRRKLVKLNRRDDGALSIPRSREEFAAVPDAEMCSWGGGHTSFTLQIMVPPHETVQRSIWKGNWGKFSWMSEAGEGCRALDVKALLENLKRFHDVQTPWSMMCSSWLDLSSLKWSWNPEGWGSPQCPVPEPHHLPRKKLFDQTNQNLPKSTAVSSWCLPVLRCTPLASGTGTALGSNLG